jgi:hypothetical protein
MFEKTGKGLGLTNDVDQTEKKYNSSEENWYVIENDFK